MLRATILIDNIANGPLFSEWGLAIYMEYNGKKILLDAGASDQFAANAKSLNCSLSDVDYAVLSHAHYDHADGMDTFFAENQKAKFYLRKGSKENCYSWKEIDYKYIGIKKGILSHYQDRIEYVEGDYMLTEGVYLIPHKTGGLDQLGMKNQQYIRDDCKFKPDNYNHEQSLVFDTEKGLVIFNSCCHGGADNIVREIERTFPEKDICALIGGFHLFMSSEDEVKAFADRIKETGIQCLYTGHCTGEQAYDVLKCALGDKIHRIKAGMTIIV